MPPGRMVAFRTRPGSTANGTDGSRTITIAPTPSGEADEGAGASAGSANASGSRQPVQGTLRLRGTDARPGRRVVWEQGTVDNEGMGKKKSKICCIYHKPRAFDESSSSGSSSDSSEDSHGSSSSGSDGSGSEDSSPARRDGPQLSSRPARRHRKHGQCSDSEESETSSAASPTSPPRLRGKQKATSSTCRKSHRQCGHGHGHDSGGHEGAERGKRPQQQKKKQGRSPRSNKSGGSRTMTMEPNAQGEDKAQHSEEEEGGGRPARNAYERGAG